MNIFRKIIWTLLIPVRLYIKYFPFPRGKGVLIRGIILPALPNSGYFIADLPKGGKVKFSYCETLGISTILYGLFEKNEIEYLCRNIKNGDVVIDIGANIGLYSVVFGCAAGLNGKVISVEPIPDNIKRIKENIQLNNLSNVSINQVALGETEGDCILHLASDSAYASVEEMVTAAGILKTHGTGKVLNVKLSTLDSIWKNAGLPKISVIKIDVEGSELSVLKGGIGLLDVCKPLLLVEANNREQLGKTEQLLSPLGYTHKKPDGFLPWNYIFENETKNSDRK